MARRLALLIGNGQFDDSENFLPLPATANDVRDMTKVLREHGDFEILDTLIDAESRTISHAIEDLYASAERGDLTLLYYSGHGYHRPPARLSLVARDTNINRIVSTAIHDATIRELIDSSRSKHRVIILDCCYSGAYIEGQKSAAEPVSFEALSGEATIVMTSSGRTQRSFALPGEKNSVFTRYLLEGIETGQADRAREGFIYPDDLFDYSDLRVRQLRPDQTPVKINKVRDAKLFLTRNPKISEAVRLLPSEVLKLLKDNAISKRLVGVLELAELAKFSDQQLGKVAVAELEKMLDDDSRRVSSLAQEQLDRLQPDTPAQAEEKLIETPGLQPNAQLDLGVAKPVWASDIGRDDYGVYADLVFKGLTQRFRFIQPGEFMMGSPENEPDRSDHELQHLVRLTEGYWLADSTCTQALWQAVMGDNPSHFKGENLPVERVSWHNCKYFLDNLNRELDAKVFRLPTEAEWEYACRAGTPTPFSFGTSIHSDQVNFNGNNPYGTSPKSAYREKTVPVKSLPCNDWGLYEMHGNVWEWCSDWHTPYDTTESIVLNPQGPPEGDARVLRGGSWSSVARYCRSAYRFHGPPERRLISVGFRLASGHQLAGSGTPLGMEAEAEPAGKPKGESKRRK